MVAVQLHKRDYPGFARAHPSLAAVADRNENRGFDGEMLVTLLIAVTPTIVAELSRAIIAYVEKNKYIKVKYNGMQIEGLDKQEIMDMLQKLSRMEEEKKDKKD